MTPLCLTIRRQSQSLQSLQSLLDPCSQCSSGSATSIKSRSSHGTANNTKQHRCDQKKFKRRFFVADSFRPPLLLQTSHNLCTKAPSGCSRRRALWGRKQSRRIQSLQQSIHLTAGHFDFHKGAHGKSPFFFERLAGMIVCLLNVTQQNQDKFLGIVGRWHSHNGTDIPNNSLG